MGGLAKLLFSGAGGGPRLPPETPGWLQEMLVRNDKASTIAAVEAMKVFDSRPWRQQIA
jgi:hypothetical protein